MKSPSNYSNGNGSGEDQNHLQQHTGRKSKTKSSYTVAYNQKKESAVKEENNMLFGSKIINEVELKTI